MTDFLVLNFTTRVLGPEATARLRARTVVQSIRSDRGSKGIEKGATIRITLDGVEVGTAKVLGVERRGFSTLDDGDAERGGFTGMSKLREAAERAGYRWTPFELYAGNVILFRWLP